MKKARKLLSVAVATLVAASLAATATFSSFAADTSGSYSITVNGTTAAPVKGHTYNAYQIFKADLSEGVLSNIEWGVGVDGDALLTELQGVTAFASCTSAADVAKVLEGYAADSADLDAFAQIVGKHLSATATGTATAAADATSVVISSLNAGYYLVKDASSVTGDDAATKFIIKVVENAEATPKSSKPTVEKKVQDNEDTTEWNDVADYTIGDKVPFQLTGTLPSTLGDYKTYSYTFNDTLSAGLTYNGDAKVYLVNGQTRTELTDGFTITPNTAAENTSAKSTITVAFTDVKAISGVTTSSKIVVEYTATLDSDAVIGLNGNVNEVTLTYSNNPNEGGEGDKGTTPKDQVLVFTYELDTTKVDGADTTKKLKDAEFKLQNAAGKWVIVDANSGKVTGWADTEDGGSTLKSDTDGLFKVIGLDEGTYSLKETKAPDGYNKLANPIAVVITATDDHSAEFDGSNASAMLTKIEVTADGKAGTGDVSTGTAAITVANNKGSSLPETGGIGTTIFFVGGGIVVAGAAIILIVKLRKKTEA